MAQASDQAYRLKPVQFRGAECQILLQNENGPCPLLAAANALLLQGKVKLPPACVRNNVASLSDLTNVLANFALQASPSEESHFYFDELLQLIPKLQDGMDVNPKFTAGVSGYEFTTGLTAFDLWHVKLVHGWLLDPSEANEELFQAVGNKTYNELIELIIHGREAEEKQSQVKTQLEQLRQQPADLLDSEAPANNPGNAQKIAELEEQLEALQQDTLRASFIDHFLQTTGHQLTQYGLSMLHQELKENELTVFFRNNHFATLTKHEGSLFLLVTDLGYANTPMVVWERLDVIDGDTEYVNSKFMAPGQITTTGSSLTPEQLMAQSGQNDADYQLALQLSNQPSDANINPRSQSMLDREEGKLIAAATEASLQEYHKQPSDGQEQPQPQQQQPNEQRTLAYTTPDGERVEMGVPTTAGSVPSSAPLPPTREETPPTKPSATAATTSQPSLTTSQAVALPPPATSQEAADALLAQQLANELAREDQQQVSHDEDWMLARQLQDEEEQRAGARQQAAQQPQQQRQPRAGAANPAPAPGSSNAGSGVGGKDSKCIIS